MNTNSSSRKSNKNVNSGVKKTLDIQHSAKISQLTEFEEKQEESKNRIKNLTKQIEALQQIKRTSGLSDNEFDEYISLTDERDDIQREMNKSAEQMDEVDYYVNTGPILFKYYDILEKGAGDEDLYNKVDVTENSILKFFMTPSTPTEEDDKKDLKDDRASLLDQYLSMTDDNYVNTVNNDAKDCCQHCGSANMLMLLNDGLNYCNDCSTVEHVIVDHDKPSYKNPECCEISYFAYKRINHLNELKTLKTVIVFVFVFVGKNKN